MVDHTATLLRTLSLAAGVGALLWAPLASAAAPSPEASLSGSASGSGASASSSRSVSSGDRRFRLHADTDFFGFTHIDDEGPGPDADDAASARRRLSVNTAGIGLFHPLACNAALSCAVPSSFSAAVAAAGTGEVTLACGTCYTYDIEAGATTTIGGLNIIGKLLVPTNHKGTLVTPYVFVQGELEMSDTNPISKDNLR